MAVGVPSSLLLFLVLLVSICGGNGSSTEARVRVTEHSRSVYNLVSASYQIGDREEQTRARVAQLAGEDFVRHPAFTPIHHAWWQLVHRVSTEWFQEESEYDRWIVTELLIEYARKLVQEPGKFDQNPWDFFGEDQLATWQYLVFDAIHVEERAVREAESLLLAKSSYASPSRVGVCTEKACLSPQ